MDSSVMRDSLLEFEDDCSSRAEVEQSARVVHVRCDVALDRSALGDEDAEDA